jgi:hypothetical protein
MRIFLFLFIVVSPVFPWGAVGHKTIAYIAEQNLNPATKEKVKAILGSESFEDIADWADVYKKNHRNTAPWHYVDLPIRSDVNKNNILRYCSMSKRRPNDNIVSQIFKDIEDLKNPMSSLREKQIALKYLVHLVGDLHMPFHASSDDDKGGNEKKVRFFSPISKSNKGHVTNLHSLWDNLIEIKTTEDPAQFGNELNKRISESMKKEWGVGSAGDWTIESHQMAKKIYADLPKITGNVIILPKNYYSNMRPVAEEHLEKAGIRLAKILEEVLK